MKLKSLKIIVLCTLSANSLFCALYAQSINKMDNQNVEINASTLTKDNWDQSRYDMFKKDFQDYCEKEGLNTLAQRIHSLVFCARPLSQKADKGRRNHGIYEDIYFYNFARELLNEPLEQDINEEWVEKIIRASKPLAVIAANNNDGLSLPTIEQTELVREAQIITNLLDERAILSRDRVWGGECSKDMIAVGKTADLDQMLFTIYHELGHINYGHPECDYTYFDKNEMYQSGHKPESFYIDYPLTSAHLMNIIEYVDLAKLKLDDSSEVGKILKKKIAETTTFWNQSQDPVQGIKTAIGRAIESQADLFACEQLLKQRKANEFLNQKKIEPILFVIREWGTSNYDTVEGDSDKHPSDLERALYMAGYLFSQGIDVNKELRQWEQTSTSTDIRQAHQVRQYPVHGDQLSEFIKEYEAHRRDIEVLDYKLMKHELINGKSPE